MPPEPDRFIRLASNKFGSSSATDGSISTVPKDLPS